MITDFPSYAPSEEHELLRRTARDIADAKIAPAATASERAVNGDKVTGPPFASAAAKCPASDPAMRITTNVVQLLGGGA